MSLALLRKELREHGVVLAAVVLFCALGLGTLLVNASDEGGRFYAAVRFAGVFGTLAAVVAANRLFAREYAGKTQLFLEVLPITRLRVMTTKWLTGAAFVLGLVAAGWCVNLLYQRRSEVLTLSDALRALLAAQAFALAVWSFSAMAGLLGRYRYVAWLGLALFYALLDDLASVPWRDAPLLRLLGDTSATGRVAVPAGALVEAGVVVLACVLLTAALGLRGSGALAAALSQRMTARERVFIIVAVLLAVLVTSKLKTDRVLPPFDLALATRSTTGRGVVGVMRTGDVNETQARALGEVVARDVESFADALHLAELPPVFLMPQRGLEPTETQRAHLAQARGIVLRAAPEVDPVVLRSRVLHELLNDTTEERGLLEDRHALLDGLAVWWAVRDDAALQERWWRRAAASSVPLSARSFERWNETSERLGSCISSALAFALVDTLAATVGKERVTTLAAQLFVPPRSGVLAPLLEATPTRLLKEAGTDWASLTAAAEERRAGHRAAREAQRTSPAPTARLEVRHSTDGDTVFAHATGVERWRVLYGPLGPWSEGQSGLRRLDVRTPEVALPVNLPRGSRLLVVVEHDDAWSGCPVRLETQRLERR